jgi:hypothetical protein
LLSIENLLKKLLAIIRFSIILLNRKEGAMAHDEKLKGLMKKLVIADKGTVAEVAAAWGLWKKGVSATNNSYKALKNLTDLGQLVQGDGYFKCCECHSDYGEHSALLTKALASVLMVYPDSTVYREHSIKEVGLRPDALILLTKDNQGVCLVLEVCNNETPEYFEKKVNVWKNWDALPYLSNLFGFAIPDYRLITDAQLPVILEELKNG